MNKIDTLIANLNKITLDKVLNTHFSILIIIIINSILFIKFGDKFGDLIIDVSREVTVPLRILEGQVLYKDFHYEYGPLVPYLFSLICLIFGSDLVVFRTSGLIITLLISIIIYFLSYKYLSRAHALLASFVFIFIFAFHSLDVNIFNFIFPYSYSSTIGVLLLLTLYKTIYDYFEKENNAALALIFLVFFATLLTKLEVILSSVTAMTCFFIFLLAKRTKSGFIDAKKFNSKKIGLILISSLLGLLYIFFRLGLIQYFYEEIIYLVQRNLSSPIGRGALGVDHFSFYLLRSIKSAVFFIIAASLLVYLESKSKSRINFILFILLTIVFSFFIYVRGYDYFFYGTRFLLVTSIILLVKIIKKRSNNYKEKVMLIMLLSSLAFTFRMIFNNTVEFYGFYLLTPACVCLIVMIFHYSPLLIRVYFKKRTEYFKYAFSVFFMIMCLSAYTNTSAVSEKKNMLLENNKGDFYVYPHQHFAAQAFLNDFKNKVGENDSIIVMPEGYMFNYFLGVTPNTFNNSHLPDLVLGERENDLIEELKAKKFDYVIIVSRYTPEWDLPEMGKDYLVNTVKYIYEKYEPTYLFGEIPFSGWTKFGILVFEKKEKLNKKP